MMFVLGPLLHNVAAMSGSGAVWTPASLGGNLVAWYDFSDLTSLWKDTAGTSAVTANGDAVARIDDKSGNGHYLIQATAGNRPTYNSGGYGDFAGPTHYLGSSGGSGAFVMTDASGQHTVGAATYVGDFGSNNGILDADNSGARLSQLLYSNAGTSQSIAFDNAGNPYTDTGPGLTLNTACVLLENTTTTTVEIFLNGVGNGSTATSGTMQSAASDLTMGAFRSGGSAPLTGRVYTAVIAKGLGSSDRALLTTYLGSKVGLSL